MPYKNPEDKTKYMSEYNPDYYSKNRKRLLRYRKDRREKDRLNWRRWWSKKLNKIRKEKIKMGTIYRKKSMFN